MKAYWGVEVQLHPFFDLCTGGRLSGQLHAPSEMPTARDVPKRSPIQVLTTPIKSFHVIISIKCWIHKRQFLAKLATIKTVMIIIFTTSFKE
jgi:hypothetical protein